MSASFLKLATLAAALAAVARADYVMQTDYSDSSCAGTVTSINLMYGGCQSSGSTSSFKVNCGTTPGIMVYAGTTCSGAGTVSTAPFSFNTCAASGGGGGGGGGSNKVTCAAGDPAVSALPTTGLTGSVQVNYADAQCTTVKAAYAKYGLCTANQPSTGMGFIGACTATQSYINVYSTTTCSGAVSMQVPGDTLGSCVADTYNAGSYIKYVCVNPVPMTPVTSGMVVTKYPQLDCKGTVVSTNTNPRTWGMCYAGSGSSAGTSTTFSCKNGALSFTSYTDDACKVGANTQPAPTCSANGDGTSSSYSCIGGTSSGAASMAAGVLAAAAAAAAVVLLA
jgi:hypothetical protein